MRFIHSDDFFRAMAQARADNLLETSRILLPSTITARRTRRYTYTLYIRHTIQGVGYNLYGWRQTVQFATTLCQRLPARTGQFTSAVYTSRRRNGAGRDDRFGRRGY